MSDAVPSYVDLIGKPFVYGGRGPDTYDCFGLVREMCLRTGVNIPDEHSPEQLAVIEQRIDAHLPYWTPCDPRPGAVALMRVNGRVAHMGFMVSPTAMLHAWRPTGGVTIERLAHWRHRVVGTYRYQP